MQSVYCKCHVGCRVLHVYQVLFGFYPFHAVFHKHFDSYKHSSKIWSSFFYNLLGLISIIAGQNIFQLCNILLYPIVIGGYWPSDIAIYCFFIYMSTGFELIFSPSIFFLFICLKSITVTGLFTDSTKAINIQFHSVIYWRTKINSFFSYIDRFNYKFDLSP